MKAAVLAGNGKVVIEDRPVPAIGPGECLVRIASVGVCNSDIARAHGGRAYRYPLVMGHEIAGTIAAKGSAVRSLADGQPVVVFPLLPCFACPACSDRRWVHCPSYDYFGSRRDGGFQEYLAVPEWNLLPIPSGGVTGNECLAEPVAVGIHAARLLPPAQGGATVAVLGGGLIGRSACTALVRAGWTPVIIDRNPFKRDSALRAGLGAATLAEALAAGPAFDAVVEAAGATQTFRASLRLVRPGGTVVWVGNIDGDLMLPRQEVSDLLRKGVTLKGQWNSDYLPGGADDWTRALDAIAAGPWTRDLVTHRIPLEGLPGMLESLYRLKQEPRPHEVIKVVVDVGGR